MVEMGRVSPLVALLILVTLDNSPLAANAPMNICEYNSVQWHLEAGIPVNLTITYALG